MPTRALGRLIDRSHRLAKLVKELQRKSFNLITVSEERLFVFGANEVVDGSLVDVFYNLQVLVVAVLGIEQLHDDMPTLLQSLLFWPR